MYILEMLSSHFGGAPMQVAKWGNSLAVRLPRKLVDRLDLKAGDEIELVDAERHRLVVAKLDLRSRAIERMAERAWAVPDGYRFDRDDVNSR
jgi:antitoxin MazE